MGITAGSLFWDSIVPVRNQKSGISKSEDHVGATFSVRVTDRQPLFDASIGLHVPKKENCSEGVRNQLLKLGHQRTAALL
jgi:hypothetical protein